MLQQPPYIRNAPWRFKMSLEKATIKAIWKHANKEGIIPERDFIGSVQTHFYFGNFALFYCGSKVILGLK